MCQVHCQAGGDFLFLKAHLFVIGSSNMTLYDLPGVPPSPPGRGGRAGPSPRGCGAPCLRRLKAQCFTRIPQRKLASPGRVEPWHFNGRTLCNPVPQCGCRACKSQHGKAAVGKLLRWRCVAIELQLFGIKKLSGSTVLTCLPSATRVLCCQIIRRCLVTRQEALAEVPGPTQAYNRKEHPLPAFSLRTFPLRIACIPCLAFLLCSPGRFMPAKLQIAWRPLGALAVEHVKHGEPGVAKARGLDAATVNARTHSSTGQEFAASFKCKICQAVPRNHHLLPAATASNFIAGVAWCRHTDKALAIIGRALDVPTCEQQQRRDVRGGSVDGLI